MKKAIFPTNYRLITFPKKGQDLFVNVYGDDRYGALWYSREKAIEAAMRKTTRPTHRIRVIPK